MGNIFQTKEWADFKVKTGYEKYYEVEGIFVLQKRLPLGRTMLYAPMVSKSKEEGVRRKEFLEEIKEIAQKNNAIFFRLELDIPRTPYPVLPTGFVKAFEEMQPEHSLILDLVKTEDEILAEMKQKGRYNIKVAEKNGVEIRGDEKVDNFYDLYSTMAKRQKITYRDKKYYQALIDTFGQKSYVKILTAYVSKEEGVGSKESDTLPHTPSTPLIPIASAIVSFYKDQAIYLFGGSSDEHRNLMAPYLVQWTAIKEAKKIGCKEYDFFGIAPDDSPSHPWAGVTRFKKQFGGEEKAILGSYDRVFKPLEYKLFKLAEKIRR